MLRLIGVTKRFGNSDAVRKVNLDIQDGEFFSILGPSGCGKTTLLRLLGGFEKPTSGEIYLDDNRIDTLPPHQRQCNTVFQRYALFPHLNVRKNVSFGLEMKKTSPEDIQAQVASVLELVHMSAYSERSITTLSGGQQQRIALARALINKPKVLLLDEPLSALDLKLRQQMKVELLRLQRKLKQTFIFVTHDQDEALTISDRIAVMSNGVVEQVGTPQEIYEFPKSLFVAEFIGSMNTLMGEVRQWSESEILVRSLQSRRPFMVRPSQDGFRQLPSVSDGLRVKVMIRPEKLKVLRSQPGPDQNFLEGTIKEILYRGPETQFFITPKIEQFDKHSSYPSQANFNRNEELPENEKPSNSLRASPVATISVVQPNSAVTAKKTFAMGDRVFIAWAPEDCLIMSEDRALPSSSHSQPLVPKSVAQSFVGDEAEFRSPQETTTSSETVKPFAAQQVGLV